MNWKLTILLAPMLIVWCQSVHAQQQATINGLVSDVVTRDPIEFAGIIVTETGKTTESNLAGKFSIAVPANSTLNLRFVRVGYQEAVIVVQPILSGQTYELSVALAPTGSMRVFEIVDSRLISDGMLRQDVTQFKLLPSTTGNLESLLPSIALGANSGAGGELTSQYQVRGGNYDENLVYVNDFEIYRPQLVRAGQQEGLTFANIDLMQSLSFSSGGFETRYGDKLSSVLDIRYKRPDSLRGSFNISFLGGSTHLEGSAPLSKSADRHFRYLVGGRYKTTRYLLNTLDITGEYQPDFGDVQTYLTFDLSKSWQLGLLGNINYSRFGFIPASRSTASGLLDFTLSLRTNYQGQEISRFLTSFGGVSWIYLPERKKNPMFLKFLASRYSSDEQERVDIIGDYQLGQLATSLSSEQVGEVVALLGTGTQQNYIRNYLFANVTAIEHKGGYELIQRLTDTTSSGSIVNLSRGHFFQWGVRGQLEHITDRINEWERLDSALYSLPFDTTRLNVFRVYKTGNLLNSYRASAYLQDAYTWTRDSVADIRFSYGVRATYWTLNEELLITPRTQLLIKPLGWQRDFSFKIAGGLYHQPAFYREIRKIDGSLNPNLLAQKSAQVLIGLTHDFEGGGKRRKVPFRLIAEAYYKHLWDVVSYELDNVRIRYSGLNDATAYVTGFDLRINGEFVPDAESWVNFSVLRAREQLIGVEHRQRAVGSYDGKPSKDVPRPTDRTFTMSMFFQDYLRKNKNFRTHMQLTVGTGLPFGFPDNNIVFRNTYRFRTYHRIDAGFSAVLFQRSTLLRHPRHILRFSESALLSFEVFNMMQSPNIASNVWIRTIYNTQYAIPNFLTSRRLNLRLRFDF